MRTAEICTLLVTLSYICESPHRFIELEKLLIMFQGFAALRMFALYGMNKLVFALVFAIGFVSPALQVVGTSPMIFGHVTDLRRSIRWLSSIA